MRKTFTLMWACMLCLLCLSVQVQAQNRFRSEKGQLEEVRKVVNDSRSFWLHMFPAAELPDYGFRDEKEKTQAVPGQPIEVYNMYRSFNGATEVQPAGEFLVPLLINGKPRVFLTVAFFEGRFQVVSVGEMNLAQEATPYVSRANETKGSQLVWLRNLNHSADFIADAANLVNDASLVFSPLSTAQRASFQQPIVYSELETRISKMLVQFD